MSFDYNYKFWVATQKDLEDILKRQEVFKRLKPIDNPQVTHYLFAELYARYVELVNKLGYIYHHTFQVQKRDVVKELVEAATQRLIELKTELKNFELSEFIYIDKTLIERRLTPDDIVVWTPKYFPYWRPANVQAIIDDARKKHEAAEFAPKHKPKAATTALSAAANVEGKSKTSAQKSTATSASHQSATRSSRASVRASQAFNRKFGPNMKSKETVIIDPVKQRLRDVAILMQSHERARVARKLLTNIRYNPAEYKPKMREDGVIVKYTFTHKPTQTMLIPVRRTRFEADYYIHRRDLTGFNYYVKPVYQAVSESRNDDLSDFDESVEEESLMEEEEEEMEEESSESELSEYSDKSSETTPEELLTRLHTESALKIQSFWKGYRARKNYQKLLGRKMQIYGMSQKFRPNSYKVDLYKARMEEAAKHRMLKERYDEEFIKFCEDERARILRVRGPWIMEDISDNIREWFREFYYKLDCFHPYPDEVKGGTLLLMKGETMTVYEYQAKLKKGKESKEELKKQKEKEKEQKKKLKEKLKKEKIALAKKRAKMKAAGIYDLCDEMERSKSIEAIVNTIEKYKKEWIDIDEKLNKTHGPITEWITSEYYSDIHQELQLTVDELMRLEFELLQRAEATDKKKKYKPPKVKKPKAKKRKGKKEPKDITKDRSLQSLFDELKDAGIVTQYPKKTIDYFIGERNHCAFELLNIRMIDTPPFKGDIKDVLSEFILGMGPLNITKPKSICFVGPTHSGKRLLCDILATEMDAVVLDIGPENTVKYQSDMKYFMHIIMKMAKILQPTILFIRDVHRVFWKKIPPEAADLNPRILAPQIKKNILKPLKKTDKIYLMGTTDQPWAANGKMKKMFQRILLLPKTEYSSSFILRRNVSLQIPNMPREFSFSPLALVTRDYNSGELVNNVQETLNVRRRMNLNQCPLNAMEFIDNFLDKPEPLFPMEVKLWDKFLKWFRKTSKTEKKRARMMKARAELLARLSKKKK